MLFFKDIKREKLADPEFRQVYARECHICGTTMDVTRAMAEMGDHAVQALLHRVGISGRQFADLADGDCCDPRAVARLCRELGIGGPDPLAGCPRALDGQGNLNGEKEGPPHGRQ